MREGPREERREGGITTTACGRKGGRTVTVRKERKEGERTIVCRNVKKGEEQEREGEKMTKKQTKFITLIILKIQN